MAASTEPVSGNSTNESTLLLGESRITDSAIVPGPESEHAASPRRRAIAYAVSTMACLLSASFTVFSLYTDAFQDELDYSAVEINIVSICAEAGLYLCVPFLGYAADASRLSYLGLVGSAAYVIGYGLCATVFHLRLSYVWMAIGFATVGVACSAVFIGSLVNCARLYPDSALLAISTPTTAYGISSLLFSQAISRSLGSGVSAAVILGAQAAGLAVVGLAAWSAPGIGRVDVGKHREISEIPTNPPASYIRLFARDPTTWTFLATFVLVSGPLEMYQNNLGLLAQAVNAEDPPKASTQVVLFSSFSTLARLCVGAYTDLWNVPPHQLLIVLLVIVALVQCAVAQQMVNIPMPFSATSAISGFAYGSVFTLYPLIVARVWGIEGFATYWGMFILGPAVGSLLFGLLFAFDFDRLGSYQLTFWCSALAMVASAIVTLRLARVW